MVFMEPEASKEKKDQKGLYDLAIPLGMPFSVIRELVEKFDLDLVKRKAKVDMVGEVDEREILVLRGDLNTVLEAKEHMFAALDRKISDWERDERGARHREIFRPLSAEEREKKRLEEESGQMPQ